MLYGLLEQKQYFDVKLAVWECWCDLETKSKFENNRIANVRKWG